MAMDLLAQAIDRYESHDTTQDVWKTGCKFVDAEDFHGEHLKPEEQRRLFPEWLIIDLDSNKIARYDHLSCRLGKIDLIPVKQVNRPQKGQQKQGCKKTKSLTK